MDLSVLESGSGGEYLRYTVVDPHWMVDDEACKITKMLFDPDSFMTGFGKLAKGTAPEWSWAAQAGTTIPRPSEDHKPAFLLMVYVKKEHGAAQDGWREWSSNQASARAGIKKIWKEIHEQQATNAGKAAIIEITGYDMVSFGPNSQPVPQFKLVGWTDKPSAAETAPAAAPVSADVVALADNNF